MSIWHYEEHRRAGDDPEALYRESCVFCATPLTRDRDDEQKITLYDELNYGFSDSFSTTSRAVIGICAACGWWKCAVATLVGGTPPAIFQSRRARLRILDLTDLSIPLSDVRDYLVARYDSRFNVHPRVFEEVVASVFRDHGYESRVTAYSGDGGVDIILEGRGGKTVGVQVKRYRARISVPRSENSPVRSS